MKIIKLLSALILILLLLCSCSAKGLPDTTQTQTEVYLSELNEIISDSSTESLTTQADTTKKEESATTSKPSTTSEITSETIRTTTATTTALTTIKPIPTTSSKVTTTKKASESLTETTKKVTTAKETTTKKEVKQTTSKATTTKPATTAKSTTTAAQKEQSFCYVTIDIRNIKRNPDMLKNEKRPFVTADGYIIKKVKVTLSPGDTAFDVLKKACKENACTDNCKYCKNGIQLESTFTPAFGSYYVKGIHQLYEMDCGSMSGWMFSVNGNFADMASSEYKVRNGDSVVFAYTCDMGEDLGQSY